METDNKVDGLDQEIAWLRGALREMMRMARGSGDLEHRIELGERTELSVLADALNFSTARLITGRQKRYGFW